MPDSAGASFSVGVSDSVAGASRSIESSVAPEKMLSLELLPRIVRVIEVIMKIAAAAVVNLVRKFAPPELPKTVWLEPPVRDALASAPFPDWMRTTRIKRTQVVTWIKVTSVSMIVGLIADSGVEARFYRRSWRKTQRFCCSVSPAVGKSDALLICSANTQCGCTAQIHRADE